MEDRPCGRSWLVVVASGVPTTIGSALAMSSSSDAAYRFVCHELPKIELHAHLNGCISGRILQELAIERGVTLSPTHFAASSSSTTANSDDNIPHQQPPDMYNVHPRSLQDCFDMFAELPAAVNDLTAVRRITVAALQEFGAHHVVYLELRSTPKRLLRDFRHNDGDCDSLLLCSKEDYVETILSVLRDFQATEGARYRQELEAFETKKKKTTTELLPPPRLPMVCRFIVSVDRSQTLQDAAENIDLAIRLQGDLVVGVDLGGNPTKRDFCDFEPLFQKARGAGLKVTIHCAEIPCGDKGSTAYKEAEAMLNFQPDRLGHAVLLPPSLLKRLDELQIPVETCPTSNIMTLELHSEKHGDLVHGLQQHATLQHWLHPNKSVDTWHPLAVGTDDPGVFHTTATQELWLLATAFRLDCRQIADLVLRSIDYAFCNDETKARLREMMRQRIDSSRLLT